ncbi:MAG: tRNA (uridine(34)/cytosine(34)/5-carboxymethylaminomethyluridine(34)-2'-O)-methyltransferase TrmL [Acidimicrobiia bacterium]|nr:tRNA (uridine(34)/cytosine(34)/5-carboxymethylaminomethyluridine(34)-2'-O)-methyltransferase TrmL [Acidimicrobiia bacterium]
MFHIVFVEPEIPPNTGNAMRTVVVTGASLDLIQPLGFEMDDTRLRRAGLDYRDRAVVNVYPDLPSWHEQVQPPRIWAFTVDGTHLYTDVRYQPGDALMFGKESTGLDDAAKTAPWVTGSVRLPMLPDVRSMNLSNATAVALFEAWRQNDFAGSRGGVTRPVPGRIGDVDH